MATPTALTEYLNTYGARLQSLLADALGPSAPAATVAAATTPAARSFPDGAMPASPLRVGPVSQLAEPEAAAPTVSPMRPRPKSALASANQPMAQAPERGADQGADEGYSFRDLWEDTPKRQRTEFTDRLEQALKKGNETIDSAFDQMVRQLGSRPSGKLSREDKAMLLMEFGLALMANSAANAYGPDLGGAIGAAGLQTLGRYREMTRGRQQQYDQQLAAIESERAKAKSRLAEAVATEALRGARAADEPDRIAGTVTTESGEIYGYTRGGRTSALRDPQTGEVLRGRQPMNEPLVPVETEEGTIYMPRSQAVGKRVPPRASQLPKTFEMKASDTNAIYRQAASLFGGTWDPITGRIAGLNREQAELVQQIAARASQIYMNASGKLDHSTAVQRAFNEVRAGRQGAVSETAGEPPEFRSEEEAQEAFEAGRLRRGDVIIVNGRRFRVGG